MLGANCSVVGVSDDPTIKLDTSRRLGEDHTSAQEYLSALVIEHNNGEAGEGWNGEMSERDHTRSKQEVADWDVTKDCNKSSLEEEREVHIVVLHSLL